jgi:DNA-binding beta-propeller fold protein YncE
MRYLSLFCALIILALLAGCSGGGGGAGRPAGAQTGSVGVRIVWPERAEIDTAFIPAASESIKIEFIQDGVPVAGKAVVINRPATTGRIDGVPAGQLIMRATAHPEAEGEGVAQAQAERTIEVIDGSYTEYGLTLASTITEILVTPAVSAMQPGKSLQLTGTALNDRDEIVLLAATTPFTWQVTSDAAGLAVDSQGLVTGFEAGVAIVQATEKETNLSGQATITVTANPAEGGFKFVRAWGPAGTGEGKLQQITGLAVDRNCNIYVVDEGTNRISRYNADGELTDSWGGARGAGMGQFDRPCGIAVDSANYVYVADYNNSRIQKFTSEGVWVAQWGSYGTGDGEFIGPIGVAVDTDDRVYVVEDAGRRVQKFTAAGVFIAQWGSGFETAGSGDGEFNQPNCIAIDSSNHVFVGDRLNSRVQKFDAQGAFITKWGSAGIREGQFDSSSPSSGGLAVDLLGHVYVVNREQRRIQMFDNGGAFITQWGSPGSGELQFAGPAGCLAVDSNDNIHVAYVSYLAADLMFKTFTPDY